MSAGLEEEIAGLAVSNYGTLPAEHPPRVALPAAAHIAWPRWPAVAGPYLLSVAATAAGGAAAGNLFTPGTSIGQVNEQ